MPSARDLTLWPLYVTFVQFSSTCKVELIKHLFMVLPKAQIFQSAEDP